MIAILGVLATVVVLVINPVQLLKQARDSTRLSDLYNINRILGLIQADNYSASFGTASTVYVSVPDSSATCANLGLPTLPSGYAYACVASSTLTKVDGTGWIPVDLTSFSAGSLLAKLPVDPTNTTSSGNYYTYVTGGSWETSSVLESTKYRSNKGSNDSGEHAYTYEIGSDLTLTPTVIIARSEDSAYRNGLVAWWTLDEGSGTTAVDSSGNGNTGTLTDGPTISSAASCKVNRCLSFDGSNDYVVTGINSSLNMSTSDWTIVGWIKTNTNNSFIFGENTDDLLQFTINSTRKLVGYLNDGVSATSFLSLLNVDDGVWHHVAAVYDRDANGQTYIDGLPNGTAVNISSIGSVDVTKAYIGRHPNASANFFNGFIDDIRIYNRALSAAEVLEIYNMTK